MSLRWVVALLALALVGCAHAPSQDRESSGPRASEYYPLALGNRWTYEGTFLGQRRSQEVEIVSAQGGAFKDSQGASLTVDAFGVRDDKRYLLREPIEVGRTWTNVVSVSSIEHYEILEVEAGCEVPAGRFTNCVRVEGKNRIDNQTTLFNELTFAQGVGLVRVQVIAQAGDKRIPQTELALKRYELRPKKVSDRR